MPWHPEYEEDPDDLRGTRHMSNDELRQWWIHGAYPEPGDSDPTDPMPDTCHFCGKDLPTDYDSALVEDAASLRIVVEGREPLHAAEHLAGRAMAIANWCACEDCIVKQSTTNYEPTSGELDAYNNSGPAMPHIPRQTP